MTVSERLFDAGLLDAFDAAARARDRSKMIRIFMDLDVEDAAWSVDTILGKPEDYSL